MAKCLVTGGAGFIGSHVVKHLLNNGNTVIVVDDFSGGFEDNLFFHERLIVHHASVTDANFIDKLFEAEKFDYVYHLAAYAAEALSHFIRRFNYENNLIGSINLINASINTNVKCFVFTSSIAVYGNNINPMRESYVPHPEDPYGIAKLAVEQDLKSAHEMFGLNYVIFRPHNVFGIHQNIGDKYRNVIGIFMNQILNDEPVTIFGDGEQERAFSYIDDVAPYIANSAFYERCYNNVFNIGGDTPYTVNQLVAQISKVFKKNITVSYLSARNEVKVAYADHSKIKDYFEMSTPIDLETGMKRMYEWVIASGSRKTKKFKNIEVTKNLPASWL